MRRGGWSAGECAACGERWERRNTNGFGSGTRSVRQAVGKAVAAIRRAGGALLLHRAARDERIDGGIERKPSARLGEQMNGRCPASRHRHAVAWQDDDAPLVEWLDFNRRDALAAACAFHHVARPDLDSDLACRDKLMAAV